MQKKFHFSGNYRRYKANERTLNHSDQVPSFKTIQCLGIYTYLMIEKINLGFFIKKWVKYAFKTQNMGQWTSYFNQKPHITTLCHTLHTSWTN